MICKCWDTVCTFFDHPCNTVLATNSICLKAILPDSGEEEYKEYQFKWHTEELQTKFPSIKIPRSNKRSINIANISEGSYQIIVEVKRLGQETPKRRNLKEKFKKFDSRKTKDIEIGSGKAEASFVVYPGAMNFWVILFHMFNTIKNYLRELFSTL